MGYEPFLFPFFAVLFVYFDNYVFDKACWQEESNEGRMADALAHRGDEGRDKLR